jgi:hypothetical protein
VKSHRASRKQPILSVPIDTIADASLQTHQTTRGATALRCDMCGEPIEGEPAGRGLLLWTRGAVRIDEEPALCVGCSTTIGVTTLNALNVEEEEG